MNLHRLVAPGPALKPQLQLHEVIHRPGGSIMLTYFDWSPEYELDARGRIVQLTPGRFDNPHITGWRRAYHPYTVHSAARRSRGWTCPEGFTHRRYWSHGTRSSRWGIHMCEHNFEFNPITGERVT